MIIFEYLGMRIIAFLGQYLMIIRRQDLKIEIETKHAFPFIGANSTGGRHDCLIINLKIEYKQGRRIL